MSITISSRLVRAVRSRRVAALAVGLVAVLAAACGPPLRDETFGDGGYVQVGGEIVGWEPRRVLVQPDGKLLVLVNAEDPSNSVLVVRLNPNGSLDAGFGDGGVLPTGMTGTARCTDIELQPDGRLLFSGVDQRPQRADYAVWRFESDGTRDTTFGVDGVATIPDGRFGGACEMALQPDGRIVTGGPAFGDPVFARFTADGRLDTSFGDGGVVVPLSWQGEFDNDVHVRDLVLRPDGRILAGGDRLRPDSDQPESMVFTQLRADGTLDTGFGESGTAIVTLPSGLADMALRPDGRIVVAATSERLLVAQFTTTGVLDARFGHGGISTAAVDGPATARSVALLDDGSVIVAGHGFYIEPREGPDGFIVAKWTPAGALDTGFGTGGVAIEDRFDDADEDRFGGDEMAFAMAVQADGKIVVAGQVPDTSPRPGLMRKDLGIYRFDRP